MRFERLPNNVLLALGIDERIEKEILFFVFEGMHRREWLLRLKLEIEIAKYYYFVGNLIHESQGLFYDKKFFRTKSFSLIIYKIYAWRF